MNKEKLEKLRKNANQVRTGGKHTVRRKKKVVRKNASVDDKKLQATLKKLGCNALPGIEEVTLFKNDGNVIQFKNPKVSFSMQMNVFAVTGTHEERPLLPKDIAEKLGAMRNLREKDDEIPDLEDGKTFEDVSEIPNLVETDKKTETPQTTETNKTETTTQTKVETPQTTETNKTETTTQTKVD